jgi:hypothetical protein
MATNKEVANIILQQLGGRKFIAMTGAKNFGCDNNMLGFSLPHIGGSKVRSRRLSLCLPLTYAAPGGPVSLMFYF